MFKPFYLLPLQAVCSRGPLEHQGSHLYRYSTYNRGNSMNDVVSKCDVVGNACCNESDNKSCYVECCT